MDFDSADSRRQLRSDVEDTSVGASSFGSTLSFLEIMGDAKNPISAKDQSAKATDATKATDALAELARKSSNEESVGSFAKSLLKSNSGDYVDAVFRAAQKGDADTKKAFEKALSSLWQDGLKDPSVLKQLLEHPSKELRHWARAKELLHIVDDEEDFDKRSLAWPALRKFVESNVKNGEGAYALDTIFRAVLPGAHKEYSPEVRHRVYQAVDPLWTEARDDDSSAKLRTLLAHDSVELRRWVQHRIKQGR